MTKQREDTKTTKSQSNTTVLGLVVSSRKELGFENSTESSTARPSHNHLEGNHTESDTRYDTITNSILNRPKSDDSAEIPS